MALLGVTDVVAFETLVIIVDATAQGEVPGTLYTIEPDLSELESYGENNQVPMIETHGMNPMRVLRVVKAMGGKFKKILLVGCEPETFGPEEGRIGLSEPVAAAIDDAMRMVESLVADELAAAPVQAIYENRGRSQYESEERIG